MDTYGYQSEFATRIRWNTNTIQKLPVTVWSKMGKKSVDSQPVLSSRPAPNGSTSSSYRNGGINITTVSATIGLQTAGYQRLDPYPN